MTNPRGTSGVATTGRALRTAQNLAGANSRVTRYADGMLKVVDLWRLGEQGYNLWDRKTRFLVRISSDDPIYGYVHQWYLSQLPEQNRRAVVLESQRVDDQEDDYGYGDSRKVVARSDDRTRRRFTLGEHVIRTWIDRGERETLDSGYLTKEPDSIVFAARTLAGQRAVHDEITRVAKEYKGRRRPIVHMMNSWGNWSNRPDLPLRPLSTVVLRDGQAEMVLGDMRRFLELEDRYASGGMPWHRGYLFHGPPGTGKTSLARGLADELGLDLWYANLGDLSKDSNLLSLLSAVPPRSLLLLEDIDVLSASHAREGEPGQVSLSGLLNALDGVSTPHGLITVMTTNEVEHLDEALTRPGRVDVRLLLDDLDQAQAREMFTRFYGRPPAQDLDLAVGASAADLYEAFKRHIDNPEVVEADGFTIEHRADVDDGARLEGSSGPGSISAEPILDLEAVAMRVAGRRRR